MGQKLRFLLLFKLKPSINSVVCKVYMICVISVVVSSLIRIWYATNPSCITQGHTVELQWDTRLMCELKHLLGLLNMRMKMVALFVWGKFLKINHLDQVNVQPVKWIYVCVKNNRLGISMQFTHTSENRNSKDIWRVIWLNGRSDCFLFGGNMNRELDQIMTPGAEPHRERSAF